MLVKWSWHGRLASLLHPCLRTWYEGGSESMALILSVSIHEYVRHFDDCSEYTDSGLPEDGSPVEETPKPVSK